MGIGLSRMDLKKGEWDNDIDQNPEKIVEFQHCGYECSIVRNLRTYNYAGHVTLPIEHPDAGKTYGALNAEGAVSVHGDLAFGDGVDHVFGFHCNHVALGDISSVEETKRASSSSSSTGVRPHYWTFEEAKAETKSLAEQFHKRGAQNIAVQK